jgi:hypothetical protein
MGPFKGCAGYHSLKFLLIVTPIKRASGLLSQVALVERRVRLEPLSHKAYFAQFSRFCVYAVESRVYRLALLLVEIEAMLIEKGSRFVIGVLGRARNVCNSLFDLAPLDTRSSAH